MMPDDSSVVVAQEVPTNGT